MQQIRIQKQARKQATAERLADRPEISDRTRRVIARLEGETDHE